MIKKEKIYKIPIIIDFMNNNYFVFIPAGSSYSIDGILKHHLSFGNKSILERTIDESLKAGFKVVTTVRESDELSAKYKDNSDVVILESKEKLVESCLFGLVEGIINHFYENKFRGSWNSIHEVKKHIKDESFDNLRLIYLGSDAPFLRSEDIVSFIKNYERTGPELYIGVTDMNLFDKINHDLNLKLDKIDSTISNHCITDIGRLRISNMYVMNPKKLILSGFSGAIQPIYDYRELSKVENKGYKSLTSKLGMVSGISKMFGKAILRLPNTIQLIYDTHILFEQVKGVEDKIVNVDKVLSNASRIFNFDVGIYKTSVAPLLDVDDKDSYELFLDRKDDIIRYIRNQ